MLYLVCWMDSLKAKTNGGSRICKGARVERRRPKIAEWPSAAGASIEAPKAPRAVWFGEGVPPSQWGGVWGGGIASPHNIFSILSLKMATFSVFWALFLQFIVHSSMDCLKRYRRQKPLLVGKLAVVYMQIALGDKTSVLETTLWFMQRKTNWGLGRGNLEFFFRFWVCKWRLLVHSGRLTTWRGGHALRPPLDPPVAKTMRCWVVCR